MPNLPPLDRFEVRSEENKLGLPTRIFRQLEQWREQLRPTPLMLQDSGSPEGVRSAAQGVLYLDLAGGPGARLYVKTTTSGATGWEAI